MSDQVAVMNGGRLEQLGSPEDVYLRPCTAFVAGFLGAVNWIGKVGVRPEAMRLAGSGTGDAARSRSGVVTGTVFLGDSIQILVRLSSGEDAVVQVHCGSNTFHKGDSVFLCWNAADEMVFP